MSDLWQQQPLILASSSTSRQQLLTVIGLQFIKRTQDLFNDEHAVQQDSVNNLH